MKLQRVLNFIREDVENLIDDIRAIGGYIPENHEEILREWVEKGTTIIRGDIDGLLIYSEYEDTLYPRLIVINKKIRRTFFGAKIINNLWNEMESKSQKTIVLHEPKVESQGVAFLIRRGYKIMGDTGTEIIFQKEMR